MSLRKEDYREYLEKTYAAWLGKNIGIRLGAPVEGWTSDKIEEEYHGKQGYLCDYDIFAADDDSNGPLFFVRALLEKNDVSAEEIGNTFLAYIQEYLGFFWWGGVGVSTEHTAYENLKNGIKAPRSGSKEQNGIAIAEQIGGQIFSDCWGYVNGYDVDLAVSLAKKASSVSHDENGIEGGAFVAACIALAYQYDDIYEVLDRALAYLNPEMEYYQKVRSIIDFYHDHPENWKDCLRFIQENYGYDKYPGVCHIIPNLCVMVMGMCYGENDFSKTLTIINQSGWDTDCNCGNVGSIMGALVGIDGIDSSWITPINDVVNASSCIGYLNIQSISASAKLFAYLAFKLQGIEIDDKWHFDLPYATEGFRGNGDIKIENNRLSFDGTELYHYSYYLGKDIYDARYDPSFSPIVYPNDTIRFHLEGKSMVRIFVEDCDGNREYGETVKSDGWIQYQILTGVNKTIHRYGLEIIENHEGIQLLNYEIIHHPVLKLDFKNYPIDAYGPRYAGDSLYNLRGFVVHSGQWMVDGEGLKYTSKEHGIMTTLVPSKIHRMEVDYSGDNLLAIYWFKDYLNYKAVGIVGNQLVHTTIEDGIKKVYTLKEKIDIKTNKHFFLEMNNDIISVGFNENGFNVGNYADAGIIGFGCDQDFSICINSLVVE